MSSLPGKRVESQRTT